jgi:hypothetical protein
MKCHLLFDAEGPRIPLDGRPADGPEIGSLESLIVGLRTRGAALRREPSGNLIGLCEAAAVRWTRPDHPLAAVIRRYDLGFLPLWMRRENLERVCRRSLRDCPESLDHFTRLVESDPLLVRAQPRGLAVHWLAGNVPVLGLLSLLLSFLCKNVNVLKVSRDSAGLLPHLLEGFRDLRYTDAEGRTVDGRLLLDATAVVYADRTDRETAAALSMSADVRIAWGGREAIEGITGLPRRPDAEDIVFGPKTSWAVVGAERLADAAGAHRTAVSIARDAAAFDQHGCNSPHTVFVERGGCVSPAQFAGILAEAFETVCRHRKPAVPDPASAMTVLSLRSEYDMRGRSYYDRGLEWSVLYSDEDRGPAEPCGWRTLFVRPVDDVFAVAEFCTPGTQTVGLAVDRRRTALAEELTARGVARCPEVGAMRMFDVPWDGLFPMDRLVRWTSTYCDGC